MAEPEALQLKIVVPLWLGVNVLPALTSCEGMMVGERLAEAEDVCAGDADADEEGELDCEAEADTEADADSAIALLAVSDQL